VVEADLFFLLPLLDLALDEGDERVAAPLQFHGRARLEEPVEAELRRRPAFHEAISSVVDNKKVSEWKSNLTAARSSS